jgi:hypothetical protein
MTSHRSLGAGRVDCSTYHQPALDGRRRGRLILQVTDLHKRRKMLRSCHNDKTPPTHPSRSRSTAEGMEKSYEEIQRLLHFFPHVDRRIALWGSGRFFERKNEPVDSPAARDLIESALRPGDGPLYVLTIGCPVNVSSPSWWSRRSKKRSSWSGWVARRVTGRRPASSTCDRP